MSWVRRLDQKYLIETGDGQRYEPSWLNAVVLQEYNIRLFDYPNIDGTNARRRRPKGRKFAIEIYFQGEDHLDQAEAFRRSTLDQRHWHILHPLYDEIRVQPIRLVFDNRNYSVTKITGQVVETIAGVFPRGISAFPDEIAERKLALDEVAAINYATQTQTIQADEVTTVSNNIAVLETTTDSIIQEEEEKVSFRNKVLEAERNVNNLITEPLAALRSVQEVINFPSTVTGEVRTRVGQLIEQFDRVITSLGNLTGLSRNNKVYAETSGSTFVSASAIASITNPDFETRAQIQEERERIIDFYNNYIDTLDQLQTESQTQEDSYAPNPDVITGVQEVVFFTLANLDEIALEAQQEHVIITEADTNAIILTHRVYGLDEDDENLDRFIRTNNIGLKEILNIPKDREIVYYVGGSQ